jgi:P-type Ca2+ transporter type 2C
MTMMAAENSFPTDLIALTGPWQQDALDVAAEQKVQVESGLTNDESEQRREHYGSNMLDAIAAVPQWRKFLAQFADPLVYLLLFAVFVSFVAWVLGGFVGVPFDVIVILLIVTVNAVLGYVQETRAADAVAALQRMAAPSATVLREGQSERIASSDVVPGDVLLLAEGDAVCADARLIEAASLMVAEASLTGESEAVLKEVSVLRGEVGLGDRVNMVFNGTAVTRGRGRAIVTATGMLTEMGNVARLLGGVVEKRTPLQREIDRIGRMLGVAIIAIAMIVIGTTIAISDVRSATDVVEILLIGVSLAAAAVPEGLPAVLSVVLSRGVRNMARKQALVKKLSSVETLGSASVVCTDKTGTLTKSEMTIEVVVTPSGEVGITGTGYLPEGELHIDGTPFDNEQLLEEVRFVIVGGSLSNDAELRQADGVWTIKGDPTEGAFLVAEAKLDIEGQRAARFTRVGEIPFSSERKLMTTMQADVERGGKIAVVTKGAPDVLLKRCSEERVGGVIRPLTDARRAEVHAQVERLADRALRTLAVAFRQIDSHVPPAATDATEQELIYLGMVGIIDPPRPEARIAITRAHEAGIRVVMITGDHPRTALRIAGDLGIIRADVNNVINDDYVLTGDEIQRLDDEGLRSAARSVSVYARVTPEHKLRIVNALRADGSVVAMTGDGVNDAPALKAADIGVAMALTGTEVTKEAADLILADDNFATIVAAVKEGRAIFANIRKFLRFLLSSNIGEVLTMFLGVVFAGALGLKSSGAVVAVPLLATQILWINLLTDTAPALAMGVDPPPDDLMQRKPRKPTDRVIDMNMWFGIAWVGLVMALVTLVALDLRLPGGIFGGSGTITQARTMAFTTLVFAQLFNTFNARSDRISAFHHLFGNPWLWSALALSIVLQIAVVQIPFMNNAFDTTPLDGRDWLLCVGLASIVLWADEAKKFGQRVLAR